MIKYLSILLIEVYQKLISPFLGHGCRFYPSCSNYCKDALNTYGFVKGCIISTWRILRCNPFSEGGYEPIVRNKKVKEAQE